MSDAKLFFEHLYDNYNRREYICTDPIKYPYEVEGNVEFIAFTSAMFAYGNVQAIQKFLDKYFKIAGSEPTSLKTDIDDSLYYRFQSKEDVAEYSRLMKAIYRDYGSLENFFKDSGVTNINDCDKAIKRMREMSSNTHGINFLLTVPKSSTSKRLYMFLRWMVRKDNIDLGLWSLFDKSSLYMPVDVHISRMAEMIGIVSSGAKGRKSVEQITDFFRQLTPDDPAKYDFAISRLGISLNCKYMHNELCEKCVHNKCCLYKKII